MLRKSDGRAAKRDTLTTLKKRTKVLIGVGAGVVVLLLLAGALLLDPPVPYQFLRGARIDGVQVYTAYPSGPASGTPQPATVRRLYWLPQSADEVGKLAVEELAGEGWAYRFSGPDSTSQVALSKSADELALIGPAVDGGTHVDLRLRATLADRLQAWQWRRDDGE